MGNNAIRDAYEYRHGYPDKKDYKGMTTNFDFYNNEISSRPQGDKIESIHKKWKGDYDLLEAHHGFIQWLFPIRYEMLFVIFREDGMNSMAEQLQLHEAEKIAKSPTLLQRVKTSYELMLDFYGLTIVDMTKGTLERASNYKSRFSHLNRSFHNYLRITRILKFLGEVGLEHFKLEFLKTMIYEIFEAKTLPNCAESCAKFWVTVLRNEKDRKEAYELILKHSSEWETYFAEVEEFDKTESAKRQTLKAEHPNANPVTKKTYAKEAPEGVTKESAQSQPDSLHVQAASGATNNVGPAVTPSDSNTKDEEKSAQMNPTTD